MDMAIGRDRGPRVPPVVGAGRWLAGTLDGMAYAAALYRRGRVGEALYAHMTTNALIAGYVL
jgi:hypothetical protein